MEHVTTEDNLQAPGLNPRSWNWWKQELFSQPDRLYTAILTGVSVVMIIVLTICVPGFMTFRNLTNVFAQTGAVGLLAIGFSFPMITGNIDLSLPGTMMLSAIIGVMVMNWTQSAVLGTLVIIVVALLIGMTNGLIITRFGIPALIVTLSMSEIARGYGEWLTGSESVSIISKGFISVFGGKIGPAPVSIIILLSGAAVAHFVLKRTIYGRWIFSLGINPAAAHVSGIPTKRTQISAFMVSGFFAGMGALILSARWKAATPQMAQDWFMLDMITAAILGGVSILGGKGTALGVIIGALIVKMIANVLDLLFVDEYMMWLIKGVVVVSAIYFNMLRERKQRKDEL